MLQIWKVEIQFFDSIIYIPRILTRTVSHPRMILLLYSKEYSRVVSVLSILVKRIIKTIYKLP